MGSSILSIFWALKVGLAEDTDDSSKDMVFIGFFDFLKKLMQYVVNI